MSRTRLALSPQVRGLARGVCLRIDRLLVQAMSLCLAAATLAAAPAVRPEASESARGLELKELTQQLNSRARAGLEGDTVRIPFQIENTVGIDHPGLPVKGGIPLPQGLVVGGCDFRVWDKEGGLIPVQINRTAWWPDGSLKWILVVLTAPQRAAARQEYVLEILQGRQAIPASRIETLETADEIQVNTGVLSFSINRRAPDFFRSIRLLNPGQPVDVLLPGMPSQLFAEIERTSATGSEVIRYTTGTERMGHVATLEEAGAERVIIRVEGNHYSPTGESFTPYTLRLYAHAGSGLLQFSHSFVYTGDPARDRLRAIGIRLGTSLGVINSLALGGEHGVGHGIAHPVGSNRPIWRTAVLAQNSSLSYSIRKWIDPLANSPVLMEEGGRSQGWGRLNGAGAAVTLGVKNFWQEYPKAIALDAAQQEMTAYFYSPYGGALDLRRYSDYTHAELYETSASGPAPALVEPESDWRGRINVEDLGARYIGKTSEFFLDVSSGHDPLRSSREALYFQAPPRLSAGPAWIARTRVFGDFAPLTDALARGRGAPLQLAADFLSGEPEARKWYSFLDYGDMIHSYDPGRDLWCRDEGGYAWNNNEHCIAEGLWTAYLHSGDIKLFRVAEAMTRHVGDVDMYHLGPLAGNGTRHNVNHYGCVAKKRRMTLPENKRMYYYFTGDEHTRDLIHLILRSFTENKLEEDAMSDGRNTMDLAVYASALLFMWETTGEAKYGDLLRKTTEAICAFRINGRGIRQYIRFDPVTGAADRPSAPGLAQTKFRLNPRQKGSGDADQAAQAQTKSFLLKFGPMDMLINTAELTGSEIVHEAILEWAELLHMSEAEAAKYQGRFRASLDCGRTAAYAYKFTRDPRYLRYMESWLENQPIWFEQVGDAADALNPPHLVPRNGERNATIEMRSKERFQLRDMADLFRNTPYLTPIFRP